jgi:hypothetical protein
MQVSVEDAKKALNEQYGGEDENSPPGTGFNTFKFTKYSNAYMLVYVRTSHWDKVRPHVYLHVSPHDFDTWPAIHHANACLLSGLHPRHVPVYLI